MTRGGKPNVGVLALQGDFEAHARALSRAGAEPVEVRTFAQLEGVDALVIPGGESTTMLKLLHMEALFDPLRTFGETKPIFGTCAGAILLANQVTNPSQESLSLMDIGVERNGYGRQVDSRIVHLDPEEQGRLVENDIEAVFIRAPIIRRIGNDAKVLARYKEDPVLVEQGRHLVATFHPELTHDSRIHELFLDKVRENG
jgi:5'-phosphate synthase pdxT subunit